MSAAAEDAVATIVASGAEALINGASSHGSPLEIGRAGVANLLPLTRYK